MKENLCAAYREFWCAVFLFNSWMWAKCEKSLEFHAFPNNKMHTNLNLDMNFVFGFFILAIRLADWTVKYSGFSTFYLCEFERIDAFQVRTFNDCLSKLWIENPNEEAFNQRKKRILIFFWENPYQIVFENCCFFFSRRKLAHGPRSNRNRKTVIIFNGNSNQTSTSISHRFFPFTKILKRKRS